MHRHCRGRTCCPGAAPATSRMRGWIAAMSIPSDVIWSASVGVLVFAVGLARIIVRGELREARGLDKLVVFGPLFYAAPLAAFGTEHFTLTAVIASLVPAWLPW